MLIPRDPQRQRATIAHILNWGSILIVLCAFLLSLHH
jgi:hypothetical protein